MDKLRAFTLVVPSDLFSSEEKIVEYLKENKIYNAINEIALAEEYDDAETFLFDLLYEDDNCVEYGDVAVLCWHEEPKHLSEDGRFFVSFSS
jgi:hypothetical protein